MPVGMMRLSTATPEWLTQFHDDPDGLEGHINDVLDQVEAQGYPRPELLGLFFEIGRERAYALIKDLDDYVAVKAVARALGADGFLKLVTTAQAVDAVALENNIRNGLEPRSA